MNNSTFDLLIHAGRVVCPRSDHDSPGSVGISDGRIAAIDPPADSTATETLEFPDSVLLPGLVDLHAHPACSGSKYGVDPDAHFLPRGVTTVLSQGDAGADNWANYREETIEGSRTRVRLAISISRHGE
ncbi:MAG TPA: amidohydrolase/deacetylase family metallohydrolase, partial [Planctomycetaceae bacterium]|nr:amidohydrolase/deacetylase family metallohydrolase [Planctomycetaceae bacterium]